MKVLLSGGGTMGSVSPLLAVAEKLKETERGASFFWLGTKEGPEKAAVEKRGISFVPIFWGKFPRYLSWQNFTAPIFVFIGFLQSLSAIMRFRPDIILTAGSFVSVPTAWAGKVLGVPVAVHQQDISVGLANKLMLPAASIITVSFEDFLGFFPNRKAVWTGHPIRSGILGGDRGGAMKFFGLADNLPTVLFMGGGTGAANLNDLVVGALPDILKSYNVIHLCGRGKKKDPAFPNNPKGRYRAYEFLGEEMKHAYAAADLVVTRAGMGALTELSALGKPAIIIPIPGSHQEENAEFFSERNAAIVLSQSDLTPGKLSEEISGVIGGKSALADLSRNIAKLYKPYAEELIISEIKKEIGDR